jgi:SAM-dependent methyltransferase
VPGIHEPKDVTSQVAADIVEHNRVHHATMAWLYDYSYPNMTHWYEKALLARDLRLIRSLMPQDRSPRVLDVGTGTGRLALRFVRLGWAVHGVDLSPEMLAVCRTKYDTIRPPKGTLTLEVRDVTHIGGGASYDLISFSSVLHHLPYYSETLRRALDLLAPGGLIYITHEPERQPKGKRSPLSKALSIVDQALRAPQQVRKQAVRALHGRDHPKPQGMALTDYHDKAGLDLDAITALLHECGFEVKRLMFYKDRKTGMIAWLDTHLFRTAGRKFRLIAQKSTAELPAAPR